MESVTKHAGGRPSLFTPQNCAAIILYIQDGLPYQSACEASGVSYRTFREWMKRGEEAEDESDEYSQFSHAVLCAKAERTSKRIKHIESSEDWRAQAWLLERTNPDEFRKPSNGDENGPGVNIHLHSQNTIVLQEAMRQGKYDETIIEALDQSILSRFADQHALPPPQEG